MRPQRTTVPRSCDACGSPFMAFASDVERGRGRSCSKACNARFVRSAAGSRVPSFSERIWSKVDKDGPVPAHRPELGNCWDWTACRLPAGYGKIGRRLAHRVSYEMHHGPIPVGWYVMHACDRPSCIRPTHLTAGPGTANMRDAQSKGRTGGFIAHRRYGEANPHARLTVADVRTIRERHGRGGVTFAALGREYGVNEGTIARIVNRVTWKQVE